MRGTCLTRPASATGLVIVTIAACTTAPANPSPTHLASSSPSSSPPASGSSGYPARWSVGAPGVGRYDQSEQSLPVPAGYTVVGPSDSASKEYDLYSCRGTRTFDHKYFRAYLYIGTDCHGTINITDSIIAPPPGSANRAILVNADSSASLTLNITDSTIRPEPVGTGGTNAALNDHAINDCDTCTIHLDGVDVANTGGMCECGHNTVIEHSWLHDNYIANLPDPSLAHTGGVFPYGGSGPVEISHNRLEPGIDAATGQPVPNYWKAITAVLFTQSTGGSTLHNYQVHDNFISLGAYDMDLEDGAGISVTDNVFGPNHWGHATATNNVTFTTWTGNRTGTIDGNPTDTVVPRP
jgi:hypothetical protein